MTDDCQKALENVNARAASSVGAVKNTKKPVDQEVVKTRSIGRVRLVLAIAGVTGASSALAQNAKPRMMPYTAVDHASFVPASEATFLSDSDVLIGVATSDVAKAYPAADVGQHGVVHDQMPDGPIAVTW